MWVFERVSNDRVCGCLNVSVTRGIWVFERVSNDRVCGCLNVSVTTGCVGV